MLTVPLVFLTIFPFTANRSTPMNFKPVDYLCTKGREPRRNVPYAFSSSMAETRVGSLGSTLQTCFYNGFLLQGKATHALVIKSGPNRNSYLHSKLLLFYSECGSIADVQLVFDEMPEPNMVAWTILIGAYARRGFYPEALYLFRQMVAAGFDKRNCFSLSTLLASAAAFRDVETGKQIHGYLLRNVVEKDSRLESSLVGFYSKCGFLFEATLIFHGLHERDVVSWTIMIMAYANNQVSGNKILGLIQEMQYSGIEPNRHTFTAAMRGVSLDQGKQLHSLIAKRNWDSSDVFVGSSLIDMYAKQGFLGSARLIFDKMREKDVVCFNSIISGYAKNGNGEGLVCMFRKMRIMGVEANPVTYVGMLNGCANLGSMSLSKQLHAQVIVSGSEQDPTIQGIIVDMYAKCGGLNESRRAFDRIVVKKKSLIAWNSMIGGYGKHGHGREALEIFDQMRLQQSVHPDYITFICLLSACSHSGLIEEGWRIFNSMSQVYGLEAGNEHYCCMVDLLGRAGMIKKAYDFIRKMPSEAGASIWGALLGACSVKGEAQLGKVAAERLFELEPDCSGSYVVLANIFAARGRWDDVASTRELMDDKGIRKDAACSWIEVNNEIHKFMAGERFHPRILEIRSTAEKLNLCINLLNHPSYCLPCNL